LLIVSILCFFVSIYASVTLVSKPILATWPLDAAEAILGLLLFVSLAWIVIMRPRREEAATLSASGQVPYPKFLVPGVLLGLTLGSCAAYWQGKALGWTNPAAVGLAILVFAISSAVIFVILKLVFRQSRARLG
jgi:hypothetical protein